jgi:hypothetical protein
MSVDCGSRSSFDQTASPNIPLSAPRVGLLDAGESLRDVRTQVGRGVGDLRPSGRRRQIELMEVCLDFVVQLVAVLLDCLLVLVVPGVADPLPEQHRKHVRLEVRRIDRAAQRVRRVSETLLEVLNGGRHWCRPCLVVVHSAPTRGG